MNWEQKLAALMALKFFSFECRMRKPGDWYCASGGVECVERGREGSLIGRYGNGKTPQEAVLDCWEQLTSDDVKCLVIDAMSDKRREVKWNGYMWEDFLK